MKLLFPLLTVLLIATTAQAQEQRLVHQEVKRKFIVYTPASYAKDTQQQFPVVINFHGGGMTAREQMLYTQMNHAAERGNFIVIYPQGVKKDWNVNLPKDARDMADDIGFTEAMVAKLKQEYRIDPRRVYATGLSRGGFFSMRVASELPHLFAAVAVVGAAMPQTVIDLKAKPVRIGVMHMSGTDDQVVAFEGKKDHYLSASESHQYWARANGIGDAAARTRSFDGDKRDETDVAYAEQSGDGVSVALVTVRNGGHTWPGADAFNVGLPLGRTSRDIDANNIIWEFLSRHRK